MHRRVLLVAVLVALLSAGCFSMDKLTSASTQLSMADEMLAHPPGSDTVPTGLTREFDLYLVRMTHEIYPGASMGMWAFSLTPEDGSGSVPGPALRVNEGDTVIVNFHPGVSGFNHTIHWHGVDVPWQMDGVPFMTQKPVEAGETFTYDFIAKPAGTYWYHCHVDPTHHIDMGMYGALIIDPAPSHSDPHYDKEFLLMLDDMDRFHLEGGQPATGNLPQGGDPSELQQYANRQVSDSINRNPAISDKVTGSPARPQRNWTQVTYAPYTADYNTFLINGVAYPNTPVLVVQKDSTIRIRVVNVGNELMTLHLHGHHMLVTHTDGVALSSPYWVDTLQIGPGQRQDVYVKMSNPGMWELHDHIGRHTQNDNIFPGGAMTVLCYEGIEGCAEKGGHHHGGMRSGDLVDWRWNELWQALP
ncbi:MAG: multicopper oxidase domain-containing protein [Candidatus Thermoplasmatota archaeon]